MTNQELIQKLNKIGKLPTSDVSDKTNFPLKEFDNLLHEFTLPIDFDTAVQLINLSPPIDESCHEVEWALIHLAENVDINQLQKVLDISDGGEVKQTTQLRLDNYNEKQNSR